MGVTQSRDGHSGDSGSDTRSRSSTRTSSRDRGSTSSHTRRTASLVAPDNEGNYPLKDELSTRFVCISDTHNKHEQFTVPDGDVLIHGDFTDSGADEEIEKFNTFLASLPHPHKLVVTGNHEHHWPDEDEKSKWMVRRGLRPTRFKRMLFNARFLENEDITINGIRIHGCAWTFSDPAKDYIKISEGVDVLITHKPPLGILDGGGGGDLLMKRINQVGPRVHVFGHIHESYGTHAQDNTLFINASICDMKTNPIHSPVVFDLL